MKSRAFVLMLTVLVAFSAAQAATATFGRGQGGDYAVDKIDMVSMQFTVWATGVFGGQGNTADCRIQATNDHTGGYSVLLGFGNMFTEIPLTHNDIPSGNPILIEDAQLELIGDNVDTSATLTVSRMLTQWLTGAAGTNQDNVNADQADIAVGTEWASYADGHIGNTGDSVGASTHTSFGSDDYDGPGGVSQLQASWGSYNTFDVTDLVQAMYDNDLNAGFCIESTTASGTVNLHDAGNTSGNFTSPTYDLLLTITYSYPGPPPEHALTVFSGSGSGTYTEGDPASISADAASTGAAFDLWVGDTANVDDVNASDTTVTMLGETTVTATYYALSYNLTVVNGSGSNTYTYGEVAAITADAAPSGGEFIEWVGDTAGVTDIAAESTTISMPAADATITATYGAPSLAGDLNEDGTVDIIDLNMVLIDWSKSGDFTDPRSDANGDGTVDIVDLNTVLIDWSKTAQFLLAVFNGSGSGVYDAAQVVLISADPAPSGQFFVEWSGDVAGVGDIYATDANLVMPAASVFVTATYSDPMFTLTVTSGSGSEDYTEGEAVAISASAPPFGQVFDQWIGDVNDVADIYLADTILTMPALDIDITATFTDIVEQTISLTETVDPAGNLDANEMTLTPFDDCAMKFETGLVGRNENGGTVYAEIGDEEDTGRVVLVGIAELFNLLSPQSGAYDIVITSASLTFTAYGSDGDDGTAEVHRMLTDWLVRTPGTNETNVKPDASDIIGGVEWASEPDLVANSAAHPQSWGSADYSIESVNKSWIGGWMAINTFNVTELVQDMYDLDENYGFVLRMTQAGTGGTTTQIRPCMSEATTEGIFGPVLSISYYYGPSPDTTYTLAVVSGSGSGDYSPGDIANITADPAPTGEVFGVWTGDVGTVANTNDANTFLIMPGADISVTATYGTPHGLAVVNGAGDGPYAVGTVVDISADAGTGGQAFLIWVGDITGVINVNEPDTTITMPDAAVAVTATYDTAYSLTVVNGSGGGQIAQGRIAPIAADAALQGKMFDQWTGGVAYITDVYDPTTTVTMPSAAMTVTATYADIPGDALLAKIKYPYVPYDGDGRYYFGVESVPNSQRIQELDTLFARFGQKNYSDLWNGSSWDTERVIFTDVSTGATMYKLTNDYGNDSVYYHKGSWSANGAHLVWRRATPLWETGNTTHGLMTMKSSGTELRRIALGDGTVYKHQTSRADANLVYAMDASRLRAYNILTGARAYDFGDFGNVWHMKASMDGDHLLAYDAMTDIMSIVPTDGSGVQSWTTDANTGIHDSFIIHPTLDYVLYWHPYQELRWQQRESQWVQDGLEPWYLRSGAAAGRR